MRSHPPSLRAHAAGVLRDARIAGATVLVACSGGPDSTALLHVLALLRARARLALVAHGVDHGLRPEAHEELGAAARVADSVGVPFAITRVHVSPGSGVQARARAARLEALAAAARAAGASWVATGHTADDRAETWLMRVLRGSGPRGLAVLPPVAPWPDPGVEHARLVRPLVRARRADVVAHLARHGIEAASDPSNHDPAYLRVRVRRELVPLLEALEPRAVEHIVQLAEMLASREGVGERDERDEQLASLGRAQRFAVERARARGKSSIELRVRGGETRVVTFEADPKPRRARREET